MRTRILTLAGLSLLTAACSDKAADEPIAGAEPESSVSAEASMPPATIPRTVSPTGARVFFVTPANGAVLSNPVSVEFGIEGMTVVKAGDDAPDSGHHHLLIDTAAPDPGLPIPADEHHIHFGDGSTATEIALTPGQHTLQMLLGDHLHVPHDPPLLSEVITITVE